MRKKPQNNLPQNHKENYMDLLPNLTLPEASVVIFRKIMTSNLAFCANLFLYRTGPLLGVKIKKGQFFTAFLHQKHKYQTMQSCFSQFCSFSLLSQAETKRT